MWSHAGGSPGGTLARPGRWLGGEPLAEPPAAPVPPPARLPPELGAEGALATRPFQPPERAGGQDPSEAITGGARGPLDTRTGPQTGGVTCGYPQGAGRRVQPDHRVPQATHQPKGHQALGTASAPVCQVKPRHRAAHGRHDPPAAPSAAPQTRRARAGAQPSPFIPASSIRHGKQTETHPKGNSWPGATPQLPPPGSAWHFSNVKAKGCGANRQPGPGGSPLGWGGPAARRGTGPPHPRSCHCHPGGGGGSLGEAGGAGLGWMGGRGLHLGVPVVRAREEEDLNKQTDKKEQESAGRTGAAAPQRGRGLFLLSQPLKFLLAGLGAPSHGPCCPPGGPRLTPTCCPRGWS